MLQPAKAPASPANAATAAAAFVTAGRAVESKPASPPCLCRICSTTDAPTTARALYYNRFLDQNLRQVAFGSSFGDSISFLYDALGQLLYESNYYSSIPALQYSTLYSYDPVGNRTGLLFQSFILPNIQSSTAYAYDNLDRLTNVSGAGASAAYTFADPAGVLTCKSYNNGVYTDYAYDARGRLTGLTNRTQSVILDAYQYEYDTATMISAITRCTGGAPASATVAFAYRVAGLSDRLQSVRL
ncbi:MAG: hypothetical protein NTV22_15715 [bacterium]|nr:hypothetical protein [bacterium]